MDEPEGHYAKLHKSDTERQILYDLTYMWNLKHGTNEPTYKTETKTKTKKNRNRLTDCWLRSDCGCQGAGGGEGWTGNLGLADANYHI